MAVSQAQLTVPSNGAQVVVFSGEATNSSQVNLRNTGANSILLGPLSFLSPPTNVVATPNATGGTFAANTYYWKITTLNALGETVGSSEVTAGVVANGSVTLTWTAATGATGYKIYRSTASQTYTTPALVTTINNGTTATYTDTGAAPGAGAPPAVNAAAIPALFPLAPNEYLGLSVSSDDILVAQVQTAGTAGQVTLLGVG